MTATGIAFFSAPGLTGVQIAAWRAFAATVPWAHYRQDPAWAETERREGGLSARQPWFFWAEKDGSLCLTAIGIKRRLPVPGYVFWEFNYGPTFLEPQVLDAWLPALRDQLGRTAARVRLQPPVPLASGGDDVETLLERDGFTRQRQHGGWTTLLLNISPDETQILADLRSATQRAIKKSRNLGVTVGAEDTPNGWATIAGLQTALGRRAPVPPLDTETMARISTHWLHGSAATEASAMPAGGPADPAGAGGTALVARHRGLAVAAALVVTYHGTAHLPIIPSSRRGGDVPASHLLVWEVIRWAKAHGCAALDFVGYGMTAQPGDAMSGINQFKRGFAPLDNLVRSVAMHEIVLAPVVVGLAGAARKAQSLLARRGARPPAPSSSVVSPASDPAPANPAPPAPPAPPTAAPEE